mmetsp:Transcript_7468/g.21512  ORF Transcript_7468/g.21512 Transcript_7468/m.21512 type:complete len:262 (-) Transcript_7468:175-960(-)
MKSPSLLSFLDPIFSARSSMSFTWWYKSTYIGYLSQSPLTAQPGSCTWTQFLNSHLFPSSSSLWTISGKQEASSLVVTPRRCGWLNPGVSARKPPFESLIREMFRVVCFPLPVLAETSPTSSSSTSSSSSSTGSTPTPPLSSQLKLPDVLMALIKEDFPTPLGPTITPNWPSSASQTLSTPVPSCVLIGMASYPQAFSRSTHSLVSLSGTKSCLLRTTRTPSGRLAPSAATRNRLTWFASMGGSLRENMTIAISTFATAGV